MSRLAKRGALIVFEGCDRCGKTTQCQKLVKALNDEGQKAEFLRFPERSTAIGRVISDYLEKKVELEDHAVHLLFAANRWEFVPEMKKKLESGTTLIIDRYSFSGVAYTAAKPNLGLDWCVAPEVGLPKPDAVLFLDLPQDEIAKRGAFGEERYEQTDFQKRVAVNYKLLNQDWKMIDANKTIEDLHLEIKNVVRGIMENTEEPVEELWKNEAEVPNKSSKRKCSGDTVLTPVQDGCKGEN